MRFIFTRRLLVVSKTGVKPIFTHHLNPLSIFIVKALTQLALVSKIGVIQNI